MECRSCTFTTGNECLIMLIQKIVDKKPSESNPRKFHEELKVELQKIMKQNIKKDSKLELLINQSNQLLMENPSLRPSADDVLAMLSQDIH